MPLLLKVFKYAELSQGAQEKAKVNYGSDNIKGTWYFFENGMRAFLPRKSNGSPNSEIVVQTNGVGTMLKNLGQEANTDEAFSDVMDIANRFCIDVGDDLM